MTVKIDIDSFHLFQLQNIPLRYNIEKDIHDDGVMVSWAEMRLYQALMVAIEQIKTQQNEIETIKKEFDELKDRVSDIDSRTDNSFEHDYQ